MFKPLLKPDHRKVTLLVLILMLLITGASAAATQVTPLPAPRLPVYQEAKIPLQAYRSYEHAVMDGDGTLIAASSSSDNTANNYGTVWTFKDDGQNWNLQSTLTDSVSSSAFGVSIDLDTAGTTLLVGAPYSDTGGQSIQGKAYVYTGSGGNWTLEQTLITDDGFTGDVFGSIVELSDDGNTALITAFPESSQSIGVVYVFIRSGGVWAQQTKLFTPNPHPVPQDTYFGSSLALSADGNTALIGAYADDPYSFDEGSAAVFVRNYGNWSLQAWLTMSDANPVDHAGWSVDLSDDGNTALIGAVEDDINTQVNGSSNEGAGYIFTRNGNTWAQQSKLVKPNRFAQDYAGYAVALSGDGNTAMMGVPGYAAPTTGSGEIFTRSGSQWNYSHTLYFAYDPGLHQAGYDVSFNGTTSRAAVVAPEFGIYVFADGTIPTPTSTGTITATGTQNYTPTRTLTPSRTPSPTPFTPDPTETYTVTPETPEPSLTPSATVSPTIYIAPFELLEPGNGAVIADPAPEFRWTSYPGAYTFRLRIRDSFNETILNVSLNPNEICAEDSCELQLEDYDTVLEDNELYLWQVNINNGEVVSDEFTFTTKFAVPGAFTLLEPTNGSTVNSSAPIFRWTASENTAEYRLRVLDSFDQRIINTTISATTSPSVGDICQDGVCVFDSGMLGVALEHKEDYEWNVRAKNSFGKKKAIPAEFTVLLPVPGTFDLLTPANNSTIATLKPVLTWEESAGATEYRVRMRNDSNDTPVLKINGVSEAICTDGICSLDTALFTYLTPLENGESYFWKIQARNTYGRQNGNQKLTFTVALPGSISGRTKQLPLP